MPDWSIKFIPAKNPTPDIRADFELDAPDAERGANVEVFQGDLVSWNNTTGDEHQPAVFAAVGGAGPPVGNPTPIGGVLQPRKSSPGVRGRRAARIGRSASAAPSMRASSASWSSPRPANRPVRRRACDASSGDRSRAAPLHARAAKRRRPPAHSIETIALQALERGCHVQRPHQASPLRTGPIGRTACHGDARPRRCAALARRRAGRHRGAHGRDAAGARGPVSERRTLRRRFPRSCGTPRPSRTARRSMSCAACCD